MTEEQKSLYITMLLHGLVFIYTVDELGEGLVRQEVKQQMKRFIAEFEKKHKNELRDLFNVATDDSPDRGDAFLQAQTAVEMLGQSVRGLPYAQYPNIIDLIEGYKNGTVVMEDVYKQMIEKQ